MVCLVLVLGGSAPARAGYTVFSDLCVSPLDVSNFFSDMTSEFSGSARCEALCKRAAGDCKNQVARSTSCLKAVVADNLFYATNLVCEEVDDPSTRKMCKADYKDAYAANLDDVKAQGSSATYACGQVRDNCLASCFPK